MRPNWNTCQPGTTWRVLSEVNKLVGQAVGFAGKLVKVVGPADGWGDTWHTDYGVIASDSEGNEAFFFWEELLPNDDTLNTIELTLLQQQLGRILTL